MISYEILREKPVVADTAPSYPGAGLFNRLRQERLNNTVPNPPILPPMGMGKYGYAQWLNAHVYPNFSVGRKVTLKNIPIVLNTIPRVVFGVEEIQEIYYHVVMDPATKEPRAVGCRVPIRDGSTVNMMVFYPPSVLRPLEASEQEAYDDKLRNQESEGRNLENQNGELASVTIDGTTGEIIEKAGDI